MKSKTIATALVLALGATTAHAENKENSYYIGAMVSQSFYNEDSADEIDFGTLIVRGGYNYNESLAVELRTGTSMNDSEYGALTQELDSMLGAYAVFNHEITNSADIYMIAGITRVEITNTTNGIESTDDSVSPSFGLGLAYNVNDNFSINTEMTAYSFDTPKYGAFSIGAAYTF